MAGGKYHRIAFNGITICCFNCRNIFFFYHKIHHFFFKQKHAATVNNLLPHGGNYLRQFIGPYMWMGFVQHIFFRSKMMQNLQYAVNVSTLGAAGIKFAIAVGAGTAFAKAVIAFGVYFSVFV